MKKLTFLIVFLILLAGCTVNNSSKYKTVEYDDYNFTIPFDLKINEGDFLKLSNNKYTVLIFTNREQFSQDLDYDFLQREYFQLKNKSLIVDFYDYGNGYKIAEFKDLNYTSRPVRFNYIASYSVFDEYLSKFYKIIESFNIII